MHKDYTVDLTTITIAAVCLVVGLAAGSLLTRTLSPQEKKRRELENQLKDKEEQLKIYQQDVSDHFIKTSELISEMNRTHREISEQLASGAMLLTAPEVSRRVQDSAFAGLSADSRPRILSATPPEPPKDYAPSVPGGVLSESYGLTDLEGEGAFTRGVSGSKETKSSTSKERAGDDDDPTLNIS